MTDFRLPQYRREVFLKFYEFHSIYKSHPGCVYYLMPYLSDQLDMDMEDKLWFAYINGNTQNPVMSYLVYKEFPIPEAFEDGGVDWFNKNWSRLHWDMDRRHQKKDFPSNVLWYSKETYGNQGEYFLHNFSHGDVFENFRAVWDYVRKNFPSFGRLATFSYLEYLKIMGFPIDCDNLFLEDINGSASHRNGLAIVLGRDDLDFHHRKPKYQPGEMEWLKQEASILLEEAKQRGIIDASYFTLESTLCTYKSWHRPNRRYPNVYNDMLYERIKKAEGAWPEENFDIFWQARKNYLPKYLRREDNPNDSGLSKEKQNFYLTNGIPVMMSQDYPEFDNELDRKIWANAYSFGM